MLLVSRFTRCVISVSLVVAFAGSEAGPRSPVGKGVPFSPGPLRHLYEFGAAGNGRADDRPALERAFAGSRGYCLDGDGKVYAVKGTVHASQSLCLRNATIVQVMRPADTAPFITRDCPIIDDAAAIIDCGDPVIPGDRVKTLVQSLGVRTLFVRPAQGASPLQVNLENVRINRGIHAEAGSRSESAALWLERASRVDLTDVEITGFGKGYGLFIDSAQDVTIRRLNIHDMIFSLDKGDPPLNKAKTETVGWNRLPIHELHLTGRDGVKTSKFYGVRVQEQVTCGMISRSRRIVLDHVSVSRCLARFDVGDLPWQTDGFDVGSSTSDVLITGGTHVDSTWEGIDIVADGGGSSAVTLDRVTVTNSFNFGIKLGYQLRDVRIINPTIRGAGIAGILIYGPVRNVSVSGARITDVGWIDTRMGPLQSWPKSVRSGVAIAGGPSGQERKVSFPDQVTIRFSSVRAEHHPASYDFGYSNAQGTNVHLVRSTTTGFAKATSRGFTR